MKRGVFWIMRKRGILLAVFLGVFFVIILIGGVDASHNCGGDLNQVILRLSATDNAHGELFNQNNYVGTGEEVCFNELFPGQTGSGSRACDAGQFVDKHLILRLSDVTNAHAEAPIRDSPPPIYPIKVCYEDLKLCELIDVRAGCPLGKQQIVKLSDVTNAHLGLISQSIYDNVVCCETPQFTPWSGAFWEDMVGNTIDGSNVYVGNTVRLVARGVLPEGDTVTFEIFNDDLFNDDDIRTGANALTATVACYGVPLNCFAEAVWTITQADYNSGLGFFDNSEGDILGLYFRAVNEVPVEDQNHFDKESARIFLQPETRNIEPTANINGDLEHRGIYFTDVGIEFNHSSFDIDGIIQSVRWRIDEDNFESTLNSFTHIFTTAGMRTITLEVTDNQGARDTKQIAILVLASPGMLAFINKPYHQEIVRASNLNVDYLGNDSYVVDYIDCSNLNCLAGNCPAYTENVPTSCTTEDDTDLDGSPDIGVGGTPQDFSSLNFNWTFSSLGQGFAFNTGGFDNFGGQHRYGLPSSTLNDKLILLNLSYTDFDSGISLNQSVRRVFTLLDASPSGNACVGNELWIFDSNGFLTRRNVLDRENPPACFGPDGTFSSDDCACPSPFYCSPSNEGCVASTIDSCSDYTDEINCNNDIQRVARRDLLWDFNNCDEVEIPEGRKRCSCGWRPAENSGGACEFIVNITPWDLSAGGAVCSYECNYLSTESPAGCAEGYIDLGVQTDFINHHSFDSSCDGVYYSPGGAKDVCEADNGEYTLPCGRPELKLPFFGAIQFVISVLAVFVIYFIVLMQNQIVETFLKYKSFNKR